MVTKARQKVSYTGISDTIIKSNWLKVRSEIFLVQVTLLVTCVPYGPKINRTTRARAFELCSVHEIHPARQNYNFIKIIWKITDFPEFFEKFIEHDKLELKFELIMFNEFFEKFEKFDFFVKKIFKFFSENFIFSFFGLFWSFFGAKKGPKLGPFLEGGVRGQTLAGFWDLPWPSARGQLFLAEKLQRLWGQLGLF